MKSDFARGVTRSIAFLAVALAVLAVPLSALLVPLVAQGGVVVPAAAPWWLVLLGTLVPIVSGYLAKFLADGLKQIVTKYDQAPSMVKSVISILIGFGVGWLNTKLALATPLGADVHGWTADVLGGVLTALAQAGIYRLDKNKQLASQGSATLEQRVDGVMPARRIQ